MKDQHKDDQHRIEGHCEEGQKGSRRREFLKKAGKAGTAAAMTTVLVASAKPKEAEASYGYSPRKRFYKGKH